MSSEEWTIDVLGSGGVGSAWPSELRSRLSPSSLTSLPRRRTILESTLVIRFIANHFVEEYDPTIEVALFVRFKPCSRGISSFLAQDSYRKQTKVDTDTQLMLEITDTAGQEEFTALRSCYRRSSQGIILCFSLIARSTFDDLHDLVDQVYRATDSDSYPIVLVGCKADLTEQRVVKFDEAATFAAKRNLFSYVECSAFKRFVDARARCGRCGEGVGGGGGERRLLVCSRHINLPKHQPASTARWCSKRWCV